MPFATSPAEQPPCLLAAVEKAFAAALAEFRCGFNGTHDDAAYARQTSRAVASWALAGALPHDLAAPMADVLAHAAEFAEWGALA